MAFTRPGPGIPDGVIACRLFLRGAGAAMISTPVMTIVHRRVNRTRLPRAAGAPNLLGTLGGSVGTAVPGLVGLPAVATTGLPRTAIHDQERDAADA